MKKILFAILRALSKAVLKKYNPKVIGITGSIGKTTTKNAIYQVLKNKFNVRASEGSFNTEIGLPLTILGLENSKSIFVWIKNIIKSIFLVLIKDKKYPDIIILEMGADKVGDISYLNTITQPDIAVLTEVAPVHTEGFGNLENIYNEKTNIFRARENQICIINSDGEYISKNLEQLKEELKNKKVFTYGINSNADIKAYNLKENNAFDSEYATGIEFDLAYDNQEEHINMKYIIGAHGVYALLVAAIVGINMGMSLEEIKNELENVRFEKGRMSVIKGVKNTWIIDDTYNSSPVACKSAIKTLSISKNIGRKIAILGDMLELGKISEDAHREIGKYIYELNNIDLLITVGERSRDINREAILLGFDENLSFNFDNSEEAKKFVQNKIKQDDLILIKGSQGVRMEKITKEIMADPIRVKDLLVRQSGIWEKK